MTTICREGESATPHVPREPHLSRYQTDRKFHLQNDKTGITLANQLLRTNITGQSGKPSSEHSNSASYMKHEVVWTGIPAIESCTLPSYLKVKRRACSVTALFLAIP
ncbi:hypothetical protein E2C01_053537 [Portunus trituberculatus]|uniref:Uncharacterized protein n=1 Tax=Portunus trituberculatus TaxID=210409 RepID=A0A5B7GQC7_PORTR|nr:hypothetical protein [Portunus trituberculatus]